MGTLSYDFESDSPGSPPSGWAYELGEATDWTIVDVSGDNVFRSPEDKAYSYWYCSDAGTLQDAIMSGRFTIRGNVTKAQAMVFLRQSGASGRNSYSIAFSGQFGTAIYEYNSGTYIRTVASYSTTYSADTEYNFKVEAVGTTIRAKVWTVGGGEPGWQASGVDATHTAGRVGVANSPYNSSDNDGVQFDDISITSSDIITTVTPGTGAVAIAGYNPTVGTITVVSAGIGAITVAGYNLELSTKIDVGTGAVVIAGHSATISADQPQTATLWFKFKDADGAVKSYNIGRRPSLQSITTSGFAEVNDDIVLCDATAGEITLQLPQAAGRGGFIYWIKKTDASANAVVVTPLGADTIDGAATQSLSLQHEVISIVSDGSDWWII